MRFLRILLFAYACACLLGSVVLFQQAKGGWSLFLPAYLLVNAVVIVAGSLFERSRYKSKSLPKTGWQRTNERFIDHSTGKLMEVHYNSKIGKRKYIEINSEKPGNSVRQPT